MRIFETYQSLQQAFNLPALDPGAYRATLQYGPAGFRCDECGKVEILPHSIKRYSDAGCSSGYALTRTNRMLCYACADAGQRADLLDRTRPFGAYLSSDGQCCTTWTGGTLGAVHSLNSSRAGWHGSRIYRFHVRDVHGAWWAGRGAGRGMCCTLRPMKRPDYSKSWGK